MWLYPSNIIVSISMGKYKYGCQIEDIGHRTFISGNSNIRNSPASRSNVIPLKNQSLKVNLGKLVINMNVFFAKRLSRPAILGLDFYLKQFRIRTDRDRVGRSSLHSMAKFLPIFFCKNCTTFILKTIEYREVYPFQYFISMST